MPKFSIPRQTYWPPPEIGLRQKELCDFLSLNYRATALNAKLVGLSTHDYLQKITGWQLRNERYYPVRSCCDVKSLDLKRENIGIKKDD